MGPQVQDQGNLRKEDQERVRPVPRPFGTGRGQVLPTSEGTIRKSQPLILVIKKVELFFCSFLRTFFCYACYVTCFVIQLHKRIIVCSARNQRLKVDENTCQL